MERQERRKIKKKGKRRRDLKEREHKRIAFKKGKNNCSSPLRRKGTQDERENKGEKQEERERNENKVRLNRKEQ
jgi:hypothetical protein